MRVRSLVVGICALGLGLAALPGQAQQAPGPKRPIRLVVPLLPGGPSDLLARAIAKELSADLSQTVLVENKPGADGLVAAREVASSDPDGQTLLFTIASMLAAPLMSRPPALDWNATFAPVGKVGLMTFCLMVSGDLPVRSVNDLVSFARANPDKLAFATSTLSELMAASQFMKVTGIRMTRVPYKGGTQALPDLAAGRIQVMIGPIALALAHEKTGNIRVLATLLPIRSPSLPDVPTLAEAGVSNVSVPTWQAIFAPSGTPTGVLERLAAQINLALQRPALRAELDRRSISSERPDPRELRETVTREQAAWASLIDEFRLATN